MLVMKDYENQHEINLNHFVTHYIMTSHNVYCILNEEIFKKF